jgi:hypothetical protein
MRLNTSLILWTIGDTRSGASIYDQIIKSNVVTIVLPGNHDVTFEMRPCPPPEEAVLQEPVGKAGKHRG